MSKKVCFIGHREIKVTDELLKSLNEFIIHLIVDENVNYFLFGNKSQFDNLCYDIVSKLKEKYLDIKRVYVRNCYEFISDTYKKYLLEGYEETIYPEECKNSGKVSYVRRNQAMIDGSDFCIFYYDKNYLPPKRKNSRTDLLDYQPKSGTAVAYKYAIQKKKQIKNFYR